MKAERLIMSISLLAVLLLFSGCGKELENMIIPETGSGVESPDGSDQAEGEILRLQVSDAGFSDANTGSRAIDEGLTTTFEDGDQIGLFVVNSQNKILYANVPYTKDGDAWTAKENIRTKGYPVRVFAYYPYVPDDEIIAKVDSTADNYSAFFKQYIDELDISNQSSLVGYRKADVMACMVEVNDKEEAREALTLAMNHVMGLVIVNLPTEVTLISVEYYLKGNEGDTWIVDEITLPSNLSEESFTITGNFQPYKGKTGYRYLCKPESDNISNISFSGAFTTYGEQKEYSKNNETVLAGSSKTFDVVINSFQPSSPIEYIPQAGDFYMTDGSILPSIKEEDKSNCVGIVFWTGDPTATDPVLKKEHFNCTHGLVISLNESQAIKWQAKFGNTIQSWAEKQDFYDEDGYKAMDYNLNHVIDNVGEIQGYNNTKILKAYHAIFSDTYPVTVLDCFSTIIGNKTLPEGKTSGWYLPSPKEQFELSKVKDEVNNSLLTFSKPKMQNLYWSSAEHENTLSVWYASLSSGDPSYTRKDYSYPVRLVFAF